MQVSYQFKTSVIGDKKYVWTPEMKHKIMTAMKAYAAVSNINFKED